MLQHNTVDAGRRAHVAHAALIGLHALCCGLPAVAALSAVLAGAASGIALIAQSFAGVHRILHAHEGWILLASALLVISGGMLELAARRRGATQGFPWLYALSVCCFVANIVILAVHRV